MNKFCYRINGMHCANCEVILERQLKKSSKIVKVKVDHATGWATCFSFSEPDLAELQGLVEAEGYRLETGTNQSQEIKSQLGASKGGYWETGFIFLLVFGLYLILKKLNLIPSFGVLENMSLGFVFVIGLVAAVSSCMAVTGGLLLALAAKYNQAHPDLTGWRKFKPHLSFNLGRIIGYAFFGTLVGALGSVLSLSAWLNGVITILASLVMIMLGFNLLNLFPFLKRFYPKMPKKLAHKIHDLSEKNTGSGSFILGALTFFLPCGFTQSLQLYVLSQGQALNGGLIMLVFALGTLPALLSVGALISFIKGKGYRYLLKFAGVLVLLLGLVNIGRGWALTGFNNDGQKTNKADYAVQVQDPNVQIVDGVQVVNMKVVGYDYQPSQFKVRAGMPVKWIIDGTRAAGCARVITIPSLRKTEMLPAQGTKTITFTPGGAGKIPFSCTMGMTTPGAAFIVLAGAEQQNNQVACNPKIANCLK